MFYVQQEDRSWSLVEDIPATVDNRFGDKVFLQLPAPVIVHSTLFGRFEKPTPVLAVGISVRENYYEYTLLVRVDPTISGSMGTNEWHKDPWDTTEVTKTREGFRFKKRIIKVFGLFNWLIKEQLKAEKRKKRSESVAEVRGHREGKCTVCFHDQIVRNGKMVLHGYQRPGYGYVQGQCFGVDYPNFEISSEGLSKYVIFLTQIKANQTKRLKELPLSQELMREPRYIGDKTETFKRGTPGFEKVLAGLIAKTQAEISQLDHDIAFRQKLLKEWKPQKWPRKAPPKEKDHART